MWFWNEYFELFARFYGYLLQNEDVNEYPSDTTTIYYNPIQLHVSAFKVTINNKTGNVRMNVAWRCVRVTTVTVEELNYYTILHFWVWICSHIYPAFNGHAPSYVVICGLSGSATFSPHYLINDTVFGKSYITQAACFDILYKLCLKHFSFQKDLSVIWPKMYIGLRVNYPLFLWDFRLKFSR